MTRRNTVGLLAAVAACGFFAGIGAGTAGAAGKVVQGTVFLDDNANGRLDPGEKGIAGVRVTDSVKFVTTAADGSYKIEMADDPVFVHKGSQVVSVSWPSNTWPTGAWWARMDQVKDAASVNFGLRPDKQDGPFTFAHITDDHSSGGVVANWGKHFPRMKEAVRLVFETGDLGYATLDGADKAFANQVASGATLPVPYFMVPGNHDYVGVHSPEGLKDHPLAGAGGYTKYLGPVRWSFDYAGSHFVGVDFGGPRGGKFEGDPHPIVHEFLKNDLAGVKGGGNLFAFIHYPTFRGGAWQGQKFHHVYVFGGHSHSFACWDEGNVTYQTMIALWGAGACGLVHVDGKEVEFLYRCAGCKWGNWESMARNGQHLNFCPLFPFAYQLMPKIEPVRKPVQKLPAEPLAASRSVDVGPLGGQSVQADVSIVPNSARSVALKLHGDRKVLAVTWSDGWLTIDGIRLSMPFREWEKAVKVRLIADGKVVRMQVNGMYETTRPLETKALKLEACADGAGAAVEAFDVYKYELPADQAVKGRRRGK